MSKLAMIVSAVALLAVGIHMMTPTNELSASLESVQWKSFRGRFNKVYADAEEEAYRFAIFRENLAVIEAHKKTKATYTLGITEFADMTQEEFRSLYLMPKMDTSFVPEMKKNAEQGRKTPKLTQTTSINWTQQNGIVGPVNNQAQCGSCWSFSATEATQSARAIAGLGLVQLSEQQLVSCSQAYGNQGCNGGWPFWAFNYIIGTQGTPNPLVLASQYPYKSGVGITWPCQTSKVTGGVGSITSYKNITNCADLQTGLQQQPVSVSVDAASWSSLYTGGVFPSSSCGNQIDHAVLLVGSTPATSQYPEGIWLIQNSWGTSWGESGFIQLEGGNTCAVCTVASIPSAK